MSVRKQEGHKISVEIDKGDRPNLFFKQAMLKRGKKTTSELDLAPILNIDKKTKTLKCYESENIIKLPKYTQSDFFVSLVNAYLNNPEYNQLFLTNNNSKIKMTIASSDDAILSYTPKLEKADEIMKKAVECANILLPFTANSILCHNNYPNCAIEIISNGPTQNNTLIHIMNKENRNFPSAFNINKEVIEFLCTKVHELSSSDNLYRIALTGEALSFSLDDTNKEERITNINTSNCEKVFGSSYLDKNRLLLLVSPGEECPANQPKLEWVSVDLNEDEESIMIASNLVKGIRARHNNDLYILKESNEFTYGISERFHEYPINTKMDLNTVCQNLYENYATIKEIPITNLNFAKNAKIAEKRIKYSKIKAKINELYNTLKEQYDDAKIKKKEEEKRNLLNEKRNMKNISNKNPQKRNILDQLNSIENYLSHYHDIKYRIKKLNEKKSRLNDAIINKENFDSEIQSNNIKGRLFNNIGTYCFSTEKPVEKNKEEFIRSKLQEIAIKSQLDVVNIEKMTTVTIYVSHHKKSSLSSEKFRDTILEVCKKFSFLVSYCSDYKTTNKSQLTDQEGLVSIDIIYPKFARIIVTEIKEALLGNQLHKFRIPNYIASKNMLLDKKNQEIIKNWLKDNNLLSIEFNGENWIGNKEDVCQAYKLLEKNETLPNFKHKVIPIPLFLKKSEIWKIVENHNNQIDSEKWDFDAISNCLIVGNEEINKANEIISLLELERKPKSEKDLLGCISVCEEQNPSELQLNIYNRDKSCITNHLCTECIMSILDNNVDCFFEDTVGINFEALMSGMKEIKPIIIVGEEKKDSINNEIWPKVPIGQLLWNLANDNKFSDKAKVWLTEMLYTSLHSNKEIVTFCPDHPYIILPRPKVGEKLSCSIKECPNILCSDCNEWHAPEKQCTMWIGMRCPACKIPTEKKGGCNLIRCRCGAIWCFKCGIQFNSFNECQEHMITSHGSAYD